MKLENGIYQKYYNMKGMEYNMTEHLKIVKENSYLKLGIITLIEAIDSEKQLKSIKDFLKDLIDGVEENTRKQNARKTIEYFNSLKNGENNEKE